ncbi:hypothetical protein [uncultured Paludibaculum sp.]|uniref:hypothetical protein n=1 Tax=uncultured Paludibaculum sp. TaxID=1765020 RepID=UPI002AABA32C|nr:hypothetical protein [uncultured Paludibaculum sp.]
MWTAAPEGWVSSGAALTAPSIGRGRLAEARTAARAVCSAGGLGSLACALLSPGAIRESVRALRAIEDAPGPSLTLGLGRGRGFVRFGGPQGHEGLLPSRGSQRDPGLAVQFNLTNDPC